jgi:hypothetical protein
MQHDKSDPAQLQQQRQADLEVAMTRLARSLSASQKALAQVKQVNTADDAQLANVDLQNALQKQQEALQMMSNITKLLNDTTVAIIRKLGS